MKVGIYGAGSIGNHLAFSSRKIGADVTVCDVSPDALSRFEKQIYPMRYGKFDPMIRLISRESFLNQQFDVIFIGTPPDSHLALLREALLLHPKVICIEKPLVPPKIEEIQEFAQILKKTDTVVLAGYNHRVGRNTVLALDMLSRFPIGKITRLESVVLESWDGILKAHPWLKGPEDSYLGYTDRGGGATFEHSHGIDLWCLFAERLNLGRIKSLRAKADIVSNRKGGKYDESISIDLVTESGIPGKIRQNVTNTYAEKWVEVSGEDGTVRSSVGIAPGIDEVTWKLNKDEAVSIKCHINKVRYDDFDLELKEINRIVGDRNKLNDSVLSAYSGLMSALIGLAALESARNNQEAEINAESFSFFLH